MGQARYGRSIAVLAAFATAAALVAVGVAVGGDGAGAWTRWGGPEQAFHAGSGTLASAWPESGPPRLWQREIGEGYSGILVEGNRLYTMGRDGDGEVVLALDAKTGETRWARAYAAEPDATHVRQFGIGPRATPLLAGDRLYTVGISGIMHCLKATDGSVLWTKNLWAEPFSGTVLNHGYSSSPIDYKGTVIVPVGGETHSIVALDQKSGDVVWKTGGFDNSYSTPRIVRVGGKDLMLTFMAKELVGLDPATGAVHFTFPHENQWGQNINLPVVAGGEMIFLSSPQAGARGLKLTAKDGTFAVEEAWSTRKIQFYHVTSVQDGDWVYGSTGMRDPAFMAAVNIRTGEIGWRERGFSKANVLGVGDRLLLLDESGTLALTTATPEALTVHAQFELFDGISWTVPTVVGSTMYARDKTTIVALNLG